MMIGKLPSGLSGEFIKDFRRQPKEVKLPVVNRPESIMSFEKVSLGSGGF